MRKDKIINNSTEETIKSDNQKARWKFILILILSGFAGGVIGILSGIIGIELDGLTEAFDRFMEAHISQLNILIPAFMIMPVAVTAVWSIYNIRYSRKNVFSLIEADNAEALEKIERKLSYNLCTTSLLLIFQYLMFSIMVFADIKYGLNVLPRGLIYTVAAFIAGMLATIILQQKIVDCTRLINPEKQGSVYDINFNKKWEASCDEAEKLIIYKSAYKAYRAVNLVCIILWAFFLIMGMMTGTGFLSVIAIIIIWSVLVSVYSYYSVKYSK